MNNNASREIFHKKYGVTATVYFDRLRNNINIVKNRISSGCRIIAVVKSDCYGHGAVQLAKEFEKNGISYFAVSDLDEALELRQQNINSSVLVLSSIPQEYVKEIVAKKLTASISSMDFAEALSREAVKQKRTALVHVKVDTGMGRFGLPIEKTVTFMRDVSRLPGLSVEGIYSHLSSTFSDDIKSNNYTELQLKNFNSLLGGLRENNLLPAVIHIGSSTSLIGFPDKVMGGYYNAIRIGTLFLGFEERTGGGWPEHPMPVCELQTKILATREIEKGACISYDRQYQAPSKITVGILPIGYANGLHRDLSNSAEICIQDKRCIIIGKITLGNTIVNITGTKSVKEGTLVRLFGKNNSAYDQGKKIQRGTWEILLPLLQRCSTIDYAR